MVVGLVGVFCQAARRPSLSKVSSAPVGVPKHVVLLVAAQQVMAPPASPEWDNL